jgi:hypothetical protein
MAMADLNDKRFKFDGKSYFVAGSHECQIGSAGEKRSPLGKPKNLDVHSQVNPDKIGRLNSTVIKVTLDIEKQTGLRELIPLTLPDVPIPIPIEIEHISEKLTKGTLKLVHIWVNENTLKNSANDSPRLLNDLIDWGGDARLVNEVFVVVDAQVAEKFGSQTSFRIGKSVSGLIDAEIGGSGGRAGTVEVTLSPGAVFAYQLADIKWDAKAKKNRQFIDKLKDDQYGTG